MQSSQKAVCPGCCRLMVVVSSKPGKPQRFVNHTEGIGIDRLCPWSHWPRPSPLAWEDLWPQHKEEFNKWKINQWKSGRHAKSQQHKKTSSEPASVVLGNVDVLLPAPECPTGKIALLSKDEAVRYARVMTKRNKRKRPDGEFQCRTYQCNDCGLWHFTSMSYDRYHRATNSG